MVRPETAIQMKKKAMRKRERGGGAALKGYSKKATNERDSKNINKNSQAKVA